MNKITIYTTRVCPYCQRAKELFNKKNLSFTEIDVTDDEELRMKMTQKANGKRSVPQIFINDLHIGGCDDLYKLENEKKLDQLIA